MSDEQERQRAVRRFEESILKPSVPWNDYALFVEECERLKTDNVRLRTALLKREFDEQDGGLMCSACSGLWSLDGHRDTAWDHCHEHHPDCPDFSATGVVR